MILVGLNNEGFFREDEDSLKDRAALERRVALCEEVIRYLLRVDPGQTKKMGVFMLEYNKPKVGWCRMRCH